MTGTAVVPSPSVPAVAEQPGNVPAVVDGGGHEVAPSWQPGRFDPVANAQHSDGAYKYLRQEWGAEDADALLHRWGACWGANLKAAAGFVATYPELNEIATRYGLADHPALLECAAVLSRYVRRETQPGARQVTQDQPSQDVDAELRQIRSDQRQAQAEGRSRDAQSLYEREMALIAQRDGNRPIVNGRRTA